MTEDYPVPANPICAALEQLIQAEGDLVVPYDECGPVWHELIAAARAALAAEPDGPAVPESREPASVVDELSDEELLELTEDWPATTGPRHDLSGCPEVPLYSVFADEVVEFARAAIAADRARRAATAIDCVACEGEPKAGNQPCAVCGRAAPVVAEGDVGELVVRLRRASDGASAMGWEQDSWVIARAAELLERQQPQPVPASERLPGPEGPPMFKPDGVHPFVVRHYTDDERPSIKGNGFDGLEVGEDRQEAEEFIAWINARLFPSRSNLDG